MVLILTFADNLLLAMSDSEQEQVPELSHQELLKLVLDQRKQMEADRKEFADFRRFVGSRMVPIEDKVFALKRATNRERAAEVERATKGYTNLGDKRTVGFLADLQIDLKEKAEAFKDLSSIRSVDEETGELGPINWDKKSNRVKIAAFLDYVAEDLERGQRKVEDLWDQYAIARDSRHGWSTVKQNKKSKTFDHMGDGRPDWEETPLTHERKMRSIGRPRRTPFMRLRTLGGRPRE